MKPDLAAPRNFNEEPPDGYVEWEPKFDDFAAWFDAHGEPGISEAWRVWHGFRVACLLYRDDTGSLVGIHAYYSKRIGHADEHIFPGRVETCVRPDARRQGIGTALFLEGVRRFGTSLDSQHYTRAGYALARHVHKILRRNPNDAAKMAAHDATTRSNLAAKKTVESSLPVWCGSPPANDGSGRGGQFFTTCRMGPSAFLDLLMREAADESVQDEIARAIARDPGIVMKTYDKGWVGRGKELESIRWIWAFRLAGYTRNYKRAEPPEGSILLYRGSSDTRKLSMSWTANYGLAWKYATEDASAKKYPGNIYMHWASRHDILARIDFTEWNMQWHNMPAHTHQIGKYARNQYDEYVLDWRYLTDDTVHLMAVHPANLAKETYRHLSAGRRANFSVLR